MVLRDDGRGMNISVLIIDDHPLAYEGLAAALTPDPGIRVVGGADTGEDGLRLAADLRPDVLVLDLHLPDLDGVEVLTRLGETAPEVRSLIVTASEQIDDLVAAMSAGAAGYLTKRATTEEILRLLAQGHTDREIGARLYLSRRTVQYHLASVRRKTGLHRRSELARWVGEHAS